MFNSRMRGQVYGNPRFRDGTWIITSPVKLVNLTDGIVATENSNYKLGEENKHFFTMFAQCEDIKPKGDT